MRSLLPAFALALVLLAATPAQAQLRAELPGRSATAEVYAPSATPGFSLARFFDRDHFKIGHAYEMSYSSMGGEGFGMGLYTTSLQWQFNSKLAARADVGVAHAPFGSHRMQRAMGFSEDQPAQVYLRNAQIAYRPTESSLITLQFQQSPFGGYASPYGYGAGYGGAYGYSPYGGSRFQATFGSAEGLFWNDGQR